MRDSRRHQAWGCAVPLASSVRDTSACALSPNCSIIGTNAGISHGPLHAGQSAPVARQAQQNSMQADRLNARPASAAPCDTSLGTAVDPLFHMALFTLALSRSRWRLILLFRLKATTQEERFQTTPGFRMPRCPATIKVCALFSRLHFTEAHQRSLARLAWQRSIFTWPA